ncbi:MAG: hypothetical protein IJT41_02295 [Clostridia bacterium]|nr:hypothetical protein [Clostridia bacterium]
MRKSYTSVIPQAQNTLTAQDLARIEQQTRTPPDPDALYTFSVKLCDNEIDRDGERFDIEALETLAQLYVGKTGLFDHSMQSRDQVARIFDAEVRTDPQRQTETGEAYTYVFARAYMPLTDENRSLRAEIDAGIKREVSVHCAASTRCSICGADMRTNPCAHKKGDIINGQVCHHVHSDVTDVYEWSFVAVPAQRTAGVVKSFQNQEEPMQDILSSLKKSADAITLSAKEVNDLQKQIGALESDAAVGKAYREQLLHEAVRLGLAAMPDLDGETLSGVCGKLTHDELRALSKSFSALANRRIPMHPQLMSTDTPDDTNGAFLI